MSEMLLRNGKGVSMPEETQILAKRLAAAEQKLTEYETRITKLEASLTTLTKKIGNI